MRFLKKKSAIRQYEIVHLNVEQRRRNGAERGLALAVIVKNEAAFIEEWLKFHYAAGVAKFFLYDDGSDDRTIAIAKAAVPPEALTIIPWCQRLKDAKGPKTLHNQPLAFAHAVSNFGTDFRWMGFIDVDEFLFPTEALSLKEVLAELEHANNILLPWHMFGRQGFEATPDLIIPNYKHRHFDTYKAEVKEVLNFKCLVRPSAVTTVYVHGFETDNSDRIWNSNGEPFRYSERKNQRFHDRKKLQLNHYYAKSNQALDAKIEKGSIGRSAFTNFFKSVDDRRITLEQRVLEIERDTLLDDGIMRFCERAGISTI